MEKFIIVAIALIISVPVSLLGGTVLSELLLWFINPLFPSMPVLSAVSGWGVMIVVGFFFGSNSILNIISHIKMNKHFPDDDDKLAPIIAQFILVFLYGWMWFVGLCVHSFFM